MANKKNLDEDEDVLTVASDPTSSANNVVTAKKRKLADGKIMSFLEKLLSEDAMTSLHIKLLRYVHN